MASNLIDMDAYRCTCKEVFKLDNECSTLYVYRDSRTGEVEIVQMNADDESIRTVMTAVELARLVSVLA